MQGDQEGGVGEKMGNEAWHEHERRGILQNVWRAGVGGMGAGWVSNPQSPPGRGRSAGVGDIGAAWIYNLQNPPTPGRGRSAGLEAWGQGVFNLQSPRPRERQIMGTP